MSSIRRQTIISSLLIYIGFAFGALNTYLFTKQGLFTPEQYGLTRAFIVIGQFFYGFAGFGLTSVLYKFHPYFKDNLKDKDNDLLTVAMITAAIGFVLTVLAGVFFRDVVVQKFIAKSPLILTYYYWVFPFTFFLLFFSLLETHTLNLGRSLLPNFLREGGFRISTTILIVVFIFTGRNYDLFVKLFSLVYAISFFALLIYLIRIHQFHFVAHISQATKKFKSKMIILAAYVYGGTIVSTTASSIDFLAIASIKGLQYGAVFDFSSYLANVIQVPQRSLVSVSIPRLSRAWKEKDMATIDRIYKRSSINLLLISLFLFSLIWLNYDNAVDTLQLNEIYKLGKWVVFFLAMRNIVDMGTGINGQIIATSTFWRFDFMSNILLLVLAVPLNILLVREYGILGSAWSNLGAYIIFNAIRISFLKRKFNLQPFSVKTLWVLVHSISCFMLTWWLFRNAGGWLGMAGRSLFFISLFGTTAFYFRISPDLAPVWNTIRKKLRPGR